jgi:hypothetical protein
MNIAKTRGTWKFLKEKKKIIDHQFTEIIQSLDNVRSENTIINQELDDAKTRIMALRDSLNLAESDFSAILRFRDELVNVIQEKQRLASLIDSLDTRNKALSIALGDKDEELLTQKKYSRSLRYQKNRLESDIKQAAKINATSFKADGVRVKSNGKIATESRHRKAQKIRVRFMMAKNMFAKPGKKEIYIQILGPNNNIIGEKSKADLKGSKNELIFSAKTSIDYENEALELCVFVDVDKKELTKGLYFVNVFEGERKIGDTELKLK